MTLGPAILALSFLDRDLGKWAKPVIVFGRVPLFYYLLHLPLIHALAVLLSYIRYGPAMESGMVRPSIRNRPRSFRRIMATACSQSTPSGCS